MEIIHPNSNQLLLAGLFFGGILLQMILILRREILRWDVLWTLLICLVVFILIDEDQTSYPVGFYLLGYAIAFCFAIAGIKRDKVFIRISERSIIHMLLICMYTLLIDLDSLAGMYLAAVIGIGFLLALILTATHTEPPARLKLYMYLWHVFASLGLLLGQIAWFDWDIFLAKPTYVPALTLVNVVNALIAGMVFFPLVVNIFSIAAYVPVKGKYQSWKGRWAEIRDHAHAMIVKVDPTQTRVMRMLFIIILQGGFLVLNLMYNFVPHFAAIGLSLLLVEMIVFTRFDIWSALSLLLSSLLFGNRSGQRHTRTA